MDIKYSYYLNIPILDNIYPKNNNYLNKDYYYFIMVGEGRRKLTNNKVLMNEDRQRIFLKIEKESYSITQLENLLKINRGTLKHHLKMLTERGFITFKKRDDLPGRPVIYTSLTKEEKELLRKASSFEKLKYTTFLRRVGLLEAERIIKQNESEKIPK